MSVYYFIIMYCLLPPSLLKIARVSTPGDLTRCECLNYLAPCYSLSSTGRYPSPIPNYFSRRHSNQDALNCLCIDVLTANRDVKQSFLHPHTFKVLKGKNSLP